MTTEIILPTEFMDAAQKVADDPAFIHYFNQRQRALALGAHKVELNIQQNPLSGVYEFQNVRLSMGRGKSVSPPEPMVVMHWFSIAQAAIGLQGWCDGVELARTKDETQRI